MAEKKVYLLSPGKGTHKSIDYEERQFGRATERYLNTNGRWSSFPPQRDNRLLYWNDIESARKAENEMSVWRKMKISITEVRSGNMEKVILFGDEYIPCLRGYLKTDIKSDEVRRAAVLRMEQRSVSGESVKDIAVFFGVEKSTIYYWVKKAR